jgi:hypothetical protein
MPSTAISHIAVQPYGPVPMEIRFMESLKVMESWELERTLLSKSLADKANAKVTGTIELKAGPNAKSSKKGYSMGTSVGTVHWKIP